MRLWFTALRQPGAPALERISRIHRKFTAVPVEKKPHRQIEYNTPCSINPISFLSLCRLKTHEGNSC